jgi:hypothetical protein
MCLILRQFFFDENKISISAGTAKVIFEEEKKSDFIYHFALLIPNKKLEPAIDFFRKKRNGITKKRWRKKKDVTAR